jgi:hypothetical protein
LKLYFKNVINLSQCRSDITVLIPYSKIRTAMITSNSDLGQELNYDYKLEVEYPDNERLPPTIHAFANLSSLCSCILGISRRQVMVKDNL